MFALDLLHAPALGNRGAAVCSGGMAVERPWGYADAGTFDLDAGWYVFSVAAAGAPVTLQLVDGDIASLLELTADPGGKVYIYVAGGRFSLRVVAGGRPGLYVLSGLRFARLGTADLAVLLGRRAWAALAGGLSIDRIAAMAGLLFRRTLRGGTSFGIREASAAGQLLGGRHAASDLAGHAATALANGAARAARLHDGPVFLVRHGDGRPVDDDGLAGQIYGRWTCNPQDDWQFCLTLDAQDSLTPDALLLFAEAAAESPEALSIIADVWEGGIATTRVAWDPIFYTSGLPTPHALRRDAAAGAGGGRDVSLRQAFVIAVPVAARVASPAAAPSGVLPSREASGERPACSVIIPTRDRADLLENCLKGLFENTEWPHEVIVVDNGSREPATFALLERYSGRGLRVVRSDAPFNFSALCNLGVKAAVSPYLLFLNNDIELKDDRWLGALMDFAVRDNVGAVGARLLYGDGRLQHGGVGIGLTEACGHVYRGLPYGQIDSHERLARSSMRAAVTAACLCVSREKFDAVGGFDDAAFPVTLNDVDLCLKLTAKGWYSVYCREAEAYHLEGESRGEDVDTARRQRRLGELRAFATRWRHYIDADPWLSAAISRATEGGALR